MANFNLAYNVSKTLSKGILYQALKADGYSNYVKLTDSAGNSEHVLHTPSMVAYLRDSVEFIRTNEKSGISIITKLGESYEYTHNQGSLGQHMFNIDTQHKYVGELIQQ